MPDSISLQSEKGCVGSGFEFLPVSEQADHPFQASWEVSDGDD